MTHLTYSPRLHQVIPGGAHTYSRGDDQYSSNTPSIIQRAKGVYCWTPESERYLDYGMALRAVTLGYANDRVNQAAIQQIENGVNVTRPSLVELEAAELITALIPCAEMVKFAKNGSNVTTAAIKVARAFTGKKYVCIPWQQPFFSFDDWFIGTTPIKRGIPQEHYSTTLLFDYNSIQSLQALFDQYPNEIACVLMEPAAGLFPCSHQEKSWDTKECEHCHKEKNSFLHQVKTLCHRNGALFILDEMITGFRWHLQGAQTYFGVEPDLATFGKAMANGFSLSALVGKKEYLSVGSTHIPNQERTFLLSTTHGAEMPALGAFIEAVNVYRDQHVIEHLWHYGDKLFKGFNAISRALGLQDYIYMEGNPISMAYVTKDPTQTVSLEYRTLFQQEMIKHHILMPWIAISLAHTSTELALTLSAIEATLNVYTKALENGISHYLTGPSIKPVFRQYN